MPRTAHRVVDQDAVGQQRAVMRTRGADGEYLIATPREQHMFALGVAEQHFAIAQFGEGIALCEIGTAQLFGFGHG